MKNTRGVFTTPSNIKVARFAKIVKSSTPLTLFARSSVLSIWQGYRSNRPEVLCKNGVLRNFAKFTGKHLRQSLFLIKLQASGVSL